MIVPAEHLVIGVDAPVALVSGRAAAWLLSRAGLDQYHRTHRGDDPEADQALLALKLAAAGWRAQHVGSDRGTNRAAVTTQLSPSPQWLTTAATAERLGITPRAVLKAISVGRLSAQWAAGCWWIDPEEVEHFRARRAAA